MRSTVTRTVGLFVVVGALAVLPGCFDLEIEARDAPRPVTDLVVVNPQPRTGTSLLVRYREPLTVVGREVCLFFEEDGTRADSPFACTPIADEPLLRTHVVDGLSFDQLVTVVALVRAEDTSVASSEVRASGRALMDAPPLTSFTASLDDESHAVLTWTLPDETFIATGVVIVRREDTPPTSPDDADVQVVFDGDLVTRTFVDHDVPSDAVLHYAAWVRDREGGLTDPRTASVKTHMGPVGDFTATLDDDYGALLGSVTLAWLDPVSTSAFSVDVLRAPAGLVLESPSDPQGTVVCSAVPPGQQGCQDPAVSVGTVTYHAFVTDALDAPSVAVTRTLFSPDLRVDVFTATPTAAGAQLTWSTSGGATGVRIVRSTTAYAIGPLDPVATPVADVSVPPFLDTGVVPGVTVYYVAFPTGPDSMLTGPGRRTSTEPLAGPVETLVIAPVYVGADMNGHIELSWQQPSSGSYSSARVLRTTSAVPTSPDDGVVVCEAALTFCLDVGAPHGELAHYAVWARDAFGTFTDTPALGNVLVYDQLRPEPVIGLVASRYALTESTDRVTLTYTLAGDDTLSRIEVWRGPDGAPPLLPGGVDNELLETVNGDALEVLLNVTTGTALDLSVFTFDDAENVSAPASIYVPPSSGLFLDTWGDLWIPGPLLEGYVGDERLFVYDATLSAATSCVLDLDVGDDGPGPGDETLPASLSGTVELALEATTRVAYVCETPTGVLETSVVVWVADAAFGWSLTVAPAAPRDVGVGPDGTVHGLVANQILRVDAAGNVLGVDGLAPLTGFGTTQAPIGVAEHLEVFADGSVAVAARGYVTGQNLPLGVNLAGGGVYEAHVVVGLTNAPSVADIAVVDEGIHAGKLWAAGTLRASTTIRQGTTAAPGAGQLTVLPPYGGSDVFFTRVSSTGPEVVAVGGSTADDSSAGIAVLPNGSVAIAGTLGAEPAAFGDILLENNFAFPPWGFVAFADENGTFTSAEGLSHFDAVEVIVPHPTGGVVLAGRYDQVTQLRIARRGEGLPANLRWDRTVSTCCLVDVASGDVFGKFTGLAVDESGDIWAVGYAYGRDVSFNGFEDDVPGWGLLYNAYPSQIARTFIARYDETGVLLFARTIVSPEGKGARIDHHAGSAGEYLAVFANIRRPTALDDVFPQIFGTGSLNAMPSDLQPGESGGVLIKLGPTPPRLDPPTTFSAVPSGGTPNDVTLAWTLPAGAEEDRVIVVRRDGTPPSGPLHEDSTVVFDGTGVTTIDDESVPPGTAYFYRVYRVSAYPLYAGSAIVEVLLP